MGHVDRKSRWQQVGRVATEQGSAAVQGGHEGKVLGQQQIQWRTGEVDELVIAVGQLIKGPDPEKVRQPRVDDVLTVASMEAAVLRIGRGGQRR